MIEKATQFWNITRELDLRGLRADLERTVRIQVLGTGLEVAEAVAALIDPGPRGADLRVGILGEGDSGRPGRLGPEVLIAAIDAPLSAAARQQLSSLSLSEAPLLVVQVANGADLLILGIPPERVLDLDPTAPDAAGQLAAGLIHAAPEAMLAIARRYPSVRDAVARHLILETARVNAQFAALAALPDVVPLVGNMVGSLADIIVLTKNQALLLFKLAGIYGRDLSLGWRLLTEVSPVVGGAFAWRTLARTLIGLVPGPLGLIPRATIAFAGTVVVGEGARYYYAHGRKPPRALMQQISRDAMRLARSRRLPELPGR